MITLKKHAHFTVVKYKTIQKYNLQIFLFWNLNYLFQVFLGILAFFVVSFGGIAVGLIFGMLTAIITKYTEHVRGKFLYNCHKLYCLMTIQF